MKERPITMAAESVRGIFDDTKSQTRRLMTPQPAHLQRHEWRGKLVYEGEHRMWCWKGRTFENLWDEHVRDEDRGRLALLCPYGAPGDRLWVKETWRSWTQNNCHQHEDDADEDIGCDAHCNQTYVAYAATPRIGYRPVPDRQRICYLDEATPLEANRELLGPWRNPLFMPRWASRLTLEITEVRVQRLQEISEEDARAEGVVDGLVPADEYGPVRIGYVFGADDGRCTLYATARDSYAVVWDRINGKRAQWSSNPFAWAVSFRRLP